jgi:peptidoglycan/LPS O-acetylase OafA/YrhL
MKNLDFENKYYLQIDILKGFMILFVIINHSINSNISYRQNTPILEFLICIAVPILLIIMGLNQYLSFEKRNTINLKELYSKEYFKRKFERIAIPFLIIFFISLILGILLDSKNLYFGIGILYLRLPFGRAGNYYTSIIFQFILIFPLMYYAYKRKPKLTMIICFLIALFYSMLRISVIFLGRFILFEFTIFWCVFLISLGMFISDKYKNDNLKDFLIKNKIIPLLFLFSCFFLYWLLYNPNNLITFYTGNWYYPKSIFGSMYYLMIVLFGLYFLPKDTKNKIFKLIAYIGKSSYHIFLIQMIWFACFKDSLVYLPKENNTLENLLMIMIIFINLVFCSILGILFYNLTKNLKVFGYQK